jgi:hypothetical protein
MDKTKGGVALESIETHATLPNKGRDHCLGGIACLHKTMLRRQQILMNALQNPCNAYKNSNLSFPYLR